MRILLVGSHLNGSLESYYYDEIKKIKGITVDIHPAHSLFINYYYKSLTNRIRFRLNLSRIYKSINKSLEKKVNIYKPDVIIVFKGMEILPDTLVKLRNQGIVLINYNPDHPFRFQSSGTGNKNVIKSISLYNVYITYSEFIANELFEYYSVKSEVIPFGYKYLSDAPVEKTKEINSVLFAGTPDMERVKIINLLLRAKFPVAVMGDKWKKFMKDDANLTILGALYGKEYFEILNTYRINLNLLREQNRQSHNMRSFEIPAAGSIMITNFSQDHIRYFDSDKEIFLFSNNKELCYAVEHVLNLSSAESYDIKLNALNRSLISGYSYKDRTSKLISVIASF